MENIIIAAHILVAVSIVGLILLQQGKGAEMGASFGSGSSQTLFGPQGAGTVFSRATAILTAIFFVTSFSLAIIAREGVESALDEGIPNEELMETELPSVDMSESDLPATDIPAAAESEDYIPE